MKEIKEGTFARAINSPLTTVQVASYGNSLFGDFTELVSINGLFFAREARFDYNQAEPLVYEMFFSFDDAKEALAYFDDAASMANEYTEDHGTVAGGF